MRRAVFMGSDAFSLPVLRRLLERGPGLSVPVKLVGVVTQPDRPAGRGRRPAAGPVKLMAVDAGVPVLQPVRLRDEEAQRDLAELYPDVLVVASFGQILPRAVLNLPKRGALNLHPSLLPRLRGPSPIASTILEGLETSGTTLMEMVARMDAGPIVSQLEVTVPPAVTTPELTELLAERSADLLVRDLPTWLEGKIEPKAQVEEQATYTRLISKVDGLVDWKMTAVEIERRVRAYRPWPSAHTGFHGKQLRLLAAEAMPGEAVPGLVLTASGELFIGTGQGLLRPVTVQLEGGRPTGALEFLRGHRDFAGAILGSEE